MIKKFEIKPSGRHEAASEILSYVRERLKEFRMKQKEENRITLMFEESMTILMDNMNSEYNTSFIRRQTEIQTQEWDQLHKD